MFIIKYKNIFIGISIVLMVASIAAIVFFGIRFGIDFTGGSIVEVEYAQTVETEKLPQIATGTSAATTSARPNIEDVKTALHTLSEDTAEAIVQPTGENGYIIRSKHLSEDGHEKMLQALSIGEKWSVSEKRFNTIGPIIGEELRRKAWIAVVSVMLAIVLFIAFVFRKVSQPVPSWQYGVITLVALVHDVLIPLGALALLGRFSGAEADALFVTALLTVLGFSVHDTIVVFDRVRENLKLRAFETFSETVGRSIEQTFVRSINTSLTVVLVLTVLLFLGPASVYLFSLMLLIGIVSGTYSSIFLASPLLVVAEKMGKK